MPSLSIGAGKLLEIPAGELDDHVVAPGGVLVQRPVPPVGDLVEGQPAGQQRRDQGDGEARRLGGQGRGAGGAGVDLDDDHPARLGVVGELDVRPADDADGLDDVVGILLEALLEFWADGEHRGRAVGIARVDAHGVDVFDEADGDHLVLGVPDDLQLQLLPAQDRFLDEDLADEAGGDAAAGHDPQFLDVVDEAAAGAAHGVGRADHDRVAEGGGDLLRLLDGVGRLALRHVDAEAVHLRLEGDPVFAPFDGIHLDADHLHAVFLQDPGLVQLGGQVEARLAAQVREDRIGALVFDDLRQGLEVQGFDVGHIGHAGVGHDRGRIGIDEDDFVAELAQGLAGLGAGVVELAGLADDDGTGTDDQDFVDIAAFGHGCSP